MKRIVIIVLISVLALLQGSAIAQSDPATGADQQPTLVSVDAKGSDVREVLFDLFKQRGASFVVQTGVFYNLYLNLENVPFETALTHICRIAGLQYRIEDGIYVFSVAKGPSVANTTPAAPITPAKKPLDPKALETEITLRLADNDIRTVMRAIATKSEIPIEVASDVPSFKINAYLTKTTVRDALNTLTKAAGLAWSETDRGTILISKSKADAIGQSETTTAATIAAIVAHCDQCGTGLKEGWKYCPVCGNYVQPHTTPKKGGGS
jgi:type II secretory pathway component GspD/PulD (secretin)